MKKRLIAKTLVAAFLCICHIASNAQSTLMHYWHFNNFTTTYTYPTSVPPFFIDADYSIHDTSKARIVYQLFPGTSATYHSAMPTYMDPVTATAGDADTVNLRLGQTGGNGIRPRNPCDSVYLLFYIPTTNYQNILFTYGSESSSIASGDTYQYYDYSVDSGVTWLTSGLSQPYDSAWLFFHRNSVRISNAAVNNNPKLVFRIHFVGHNTGTSGNDRFDNVTVDADSLISPVNIHYWDFNSYTTQYNYPQTFPIGRIDADFSAIDTSKARIYLTTFPGTSAGWHNNSSNIMDSYPTVAADADTVNLRFSQPAGNSLRPRNELDSAYLLFYIPSTGYHNLTFSYASESSSTSSGDTYQVFDYSKDSGATWNMAALSMTQDSAWLVFHRTTVTFTSDSGVNNNPRLVFRIHFSGHTTGTSGNNRFDNVTLDGIPYVFGITTTPAAYGPFCNGVSNTVTASFTSGGPFLGTWALQLSNPGGTFPANATANIIGTGASSPITGTIPPGTTPGIYRVRVVNTNPATFGTDNGTNIIINAIPQAISGTATICAGAATSLSDTGSGTWSSSNTSIATVGTAGLVSGVVAGTSNITYTAVSGCTTSAVVTVNPVPGSLTGASSVCAGASTSLSDAVTGGTWSSTNTSVATVNGSGSVTGVSTGTTIISYVATCGTVSANFTVNPVPVAITGTTVVCAGGATTNLNETVGGGTWSSSSTAVATVNSSGLVTGVTVGTAIISYATICGTVNATVTVNPLPATPSSISGTLFVCAGGATTPLSEAPGGGVWTSSNTGVATINGSGTVTGVVAGTSVISYTISNSCGNAAASATVTVNPLPATPSSITVGSAVCVGAATLLTDGVTGGTWLSSSTSVATINSSGSITGVTTGTTNITYTISNSCGSNAVNTVVTVNTVSTPASVTGTPAGCAGGATIPLGDVSTGGVWSSNNTAVATVGTSGSVTTGSSGNATISYTLTNSCGSASSIALVTVNPLPSSISGTTSACMGATTPLSDAGSGTWSSSNTSLATVGSTGTVSGIAAGTPNITYTLSTGCFTVTPVTVNPLPTPISGSATVCGGTSTPFTDGGVGTWSSSNTLIATVDGSGNVFGASSGTSNITFAFTATGCATSKPVTVNTVPSITGVSSICLGFSTGLSDATTGGTWSSSNTSVATVNASGLVTSVSFGATTISYTLPATGCSATKVFNVTNPPTTYAMTGGGSYCSGVTATAPHITLGGSDLGISYQLYMGATPIGAPVTGSGSLVDFGPQTVTGCYTVVANPGTSCFDNMTGTSCISVLPLPTAYAVTGGGNYCSGGGGVHVFLTGSTIGITYQLFVGGVPVASPFVGTGASIDFGAQLTPGTYTVVATSTINGCTNNMAGSATVTINPLPAPQTITVGNGGNYCVGGSGQPIGLLSSVIGTSYQLLLGGAPAGAPVAGTGGAISFGNQTTAGTYTVLATTTATGCQAVMSGAATITINPLPFAYTVIGGGAYCLGSSAGVAIGLNGSALNINYQLFYTPVVGATVAVGGPVPGTGASILFPGPGAAGTFINVGSYSVVATNTVTSCTNNMTGSVAVTTNPLPSLFSLSGGGGYCAGSSTSIILGGSVVGTTYQLFDNGGLVGALSGSGGPLTFSPITTPGNYTVTGTISATGCNASMSGTIAVTINPLPLAQTVSGGGNYCSGSTSGFPTVTVGGSQSGVNYQLYNGATAIGSPVAGSGSALSFTFTSAPTPGSYTVVATNTTTGCVNNMTGSAVIAINPLPTPYAVTGGGNYCSGSGGVHVGLSGSNSGITYALKLGAATITTLPGTGTSVDFGLDTTSGTYTVLATNATTLCTVNMSGSAVVGVNSLPNATFVLSAAGGVSSYCSGGTGVVMNLSNTQSGVNYQLMNGGVPSGSPVAGTGAGISFPAQTAAGTYSVVATNASTACTATEAGSVTVSINALPAPEPVTGGGAYCSGGVGVTVGLLASQAGVNYQLMNGAATVGAPVTGSGAAFNFPAATGSGTYTVVGTNAAGCSSNMSGSAAITINSLPSLYTINEPSGSAYCSGGTGVPITLSSSSIGTNYQLMLAGTPVGAPVAGTGVGISFGLQTAAGSYTVVATNGTTGCQNTMTGTAPVTISTAPAAHTVTSTGTNYCPGGTGIAIGLNGSNTGTNYQLFVGSTAVGAPVPGTNTPISFGPQTTTGTYTVVGNNGCTGTMTGSVTVGLYTLPVVFNMTGGGNFCPGGAGVPVGLSGSSLGINYQLMNSGGAVGAPVAGTGFALNFGMQTAAGPYTVEATNPVSGCTSNMAGSAVVVVNPLPTSHTVTGGGNYCMGTGGVAVGLDGSDIGVHYQLYTGGSMPVGSYMTGTGLPLNFGMQTAAGTYTIVATSPTTTCNATMTGSAVVTVISLPTAYTVSGSGNYCAGGAGIPVGLASSDTGVTYKLYKGTSFAGISLAGSGSSLSFGNQVAAGVYTVIAESNSTTCSSKMLDSASIGVFPLPATYTVSGGGNYCAGGPGLAVMLSASNVGISYQLLLNGTMITSIAGSGAALNFGSQTAAGTYTVVAQNSTTACMDTMSGSAHIVIDSLPAAFTIVGTGTNYCAGGPGIDVQLVGSQTGISYQLYKGSSTAGAPVAGTSVGIDFGYQLAPGFYTAVAINAATGCSSNMTGGANVIVSPLPAAHAVAGGGSYCSGGTGVAVSLDGSNTGVSYQLRNGGLPAGPAMTGTGLPINFGLQTMAGVYTVVATNTTTGCSTTMSGNAPVSINALPAVYTVVGGGSYCAGGAGEVIGLSGSAAGVSYQLYHGATLVGGVVGGTGLGLSLGVQTAAGVYTVMALNTITGCADTMAGNATIEINSLPFAYPMTGGGRYCAGGSGLAIGLASSNTGISYQLYNGVSPSGPVVTGTGSPISFGNETVAGNYTVVATNAVTGCPATMSGAETVGINPLPAAYGVIGGGSYCAGGMGVHIGLSNSATGVNYKLMLGASTIGIPMVGVSGSPLDFGLETAAGTYVVVAINDTSGCMASMSGAATVSITPVVTPGVMLSTGSFDTLCSGTPLTLTAADTNGGATPSFTWKVNGITEPAAGSTFTYLPTDGDMVTVTLTSSTPCASPASVGAATHLSVLPSGLPIVFVTATPGDSVCRGTSVNYATTTTFGGTPTFTWVVNGINVTTGGSYAYVPANNDVVYVVMNSDYRCRTATTVPSNHITMSVQDSVVPVVTIVSNPIGASVAKGQQLVLTATITNGGMAPSYQWYINGTAVEGANQPVYTNATYRNGDSVTCQVISDGMCSGLLGFNSVIVHVSDVGVAQVTSAAADVELMPNPNRGSFVIKGSLGTTNDEDVSIAITDMLGQVVYTNKAFSRGGSINQQVNLGGNIANGMYLLTLHSASADKVFHVVIEQ